ncbi:MAG: response regulator [Desulfuromonadaceae bacterium]|nr:response regulator [Desulfuromonadaceae bacterium]MDD2848016.1 response regulator [Desulfuromonadaceae bacterium]MDD4131242.1 response regulator [Desulfuromonadaceae bacterium]
MKNRILLVDDESNVLSALKRALFDEPLDIVSVTSAEEALEIMAKDSFKVVVSDERMIGMQGAEFLAQVRAVYPHTIRIMLTGHATLEAAMKAVNEGEIYRFFAKPWDDQNLKFAIRSAVEKYDLEAENRRLLDTVKQQSLEIKVLEKRYPGISRVEKDGSGVFVLPDISDAEIASMLAECEKEVC